MAEDYKPGQLPYPEQDERKQFCKYHYKGVLILLLPILFGPILLGENTLACRMIYLSIVIYLYYILNVMAQGATAFLFIVFLPLFGITSSKVICVAHYSDIIFCTFGSIFMGIMMDSSKVSERLGLIAIRLIGTRLRILLVVLMVLSALTSILWNYTFVTAFWMKIAQAIIAEFNNAGILKRDSDEETYERQARPYPTNPAIGVYLAVCYGAILGDMLSPFQDPNGVIYDNMKTISDAKAASFLILFAVPMVLGLIVVGLWLNIIFLGLLGGSNKEDVSAVSSGKDTIKQAMVNRKAELGPWNTHGILVVVFIIISLILLITRRPIFCQGWSDQIKGVYCGDSVAIILMTVIFFAVPANYIFCRYYVCRRPLIEEKTPSLVGWRIVNTNTPWGHIFMLCAGYGFCTGLQDSTLLSAVGQWFTKLNLNSTGCLFMGTMAGSLFTSFAPATMVAKTCLKTMLNVGNTLGVGSGTLGLPFSAGIHNQFLLPVSSAASTVVAGWGNIRPFQYLLGGIVPFLFMLLMHCAFVKALGEVAFDGYNTPTV